MDGCSIRPVQTGFFIQIQPFSDSQSVKVTFVTMETPDMCNECSLTNTGCN